MKAAKAGKNPPSPRNFRVVKKTMPLKKSFWLKQNKTLCESTGGRGKPARAPADE